MEISEYSEFPLHLQMCSVVNAQGFHPDDLQKYIDMATSVLHVSLLNQIIFRRFGLSGCLIGF